MSADIIDFEKYRKRREPIAANGALLDAWLASIRRSAEMSEALARIRSGLKPPNPDGAA